GPPPRVKVLPRIVRLLERGELLDHPRPESRQVLRGDPGEALQAVTEGIELDVRDGVHCARTLEELAVARHLLLERVGPQAQLFDLGPVRLLHSPRDREWQRRERR